MALNDLCNSKPFAKPKDCEDVSHNWNKLHDLYNAFCCLLDKEVIIDRPCAYFESSGHDRFDLGFSTYGECLIDVEWNGNNEYPMGSSDPEFEYIVEVGTGAGGGDVIVFNTPLGQAADPDNGVEEMICYISVKSLTKMTIKDIIDCDQPNSTTCGC